MEIDENHIIKGIQQGNETAFRELYDHFYLRLVLFARKYTEDLELARDLVQDVFVQLFESRDSLKINSSLKSYLYSSVRNRCLNHLKHLEVRAKHKKEKQADRNPFNQLTEESIDAAELEARIYRIVKDLPDQCRKVFTMSRSDGKSNPQIAEELAISVRTVETQISKALKALRENLFPLQE